MNGKILSDIAVIVIRNEQYEHEWIHFFSRCVIPILWRDFDDEVHYIAPDQHIYFN
jgi:hypothetical protein